MRLEDKCTPLVTVLICNYNYGQYIRESVESALGQTWKNIEVIVVDDGSTDASRNALAEYQGRIKTILKDNGGQASAFNVGVAAAKGDIICFLDSDDRWHPDKVSIVVQKYKEGDYGLVCHDLALIDNEGELLGDVYSNYTKVDLKEGTAIDILVENEYGWIFCPTAGMSLPAGLALDIFPLPEAKWKICADMPMAFMAACLSPVGVVRESLGYYRLHGNNGFASFHENEDAIRSAAITLPATWYFFTLSYVNEVDRHRIHSPKSNYYYYRRCCLIARSKPWYFIFSLYKRNVIHHTSMEGNNYLEKFLSIAKFMFSDTVIAAGVFFRLPIIHKQYRRCFALEAEKLDNQVLHFILQDNETDQL